MTALDPFNMPKIHINKIEFIPINLLPSFSLSLPLASASSASEISPVRLIATRVFSAKLTMTHILVYSFEFLFVPIVF